MIKVEVLNTETKHLKGTSKGSGKPYSFKTQEAYLHALDPDTGRPARYPVGFELMLNDDQVAYPVGFYELSASSIQVDRRGRLTVNPILKAAQVKAAA